MFKLVLEKAQEQEIKLPTSGSSKKQESSRKNIYFCFIDQSIRLCGSQQTVENLEEMEYQTIWPASWEITMQVKKQQLEPDMEQQTGSKLGKEYVKAVYCPCAYLTYMYHEPMDTLSSTKGARIYNGKKTTSLTSGAGKTGQPLVKEWN